MKALLPVLALCALSAIPLIAQDKKPDDKKPAPAPVAKVEQYKIGSVVDEKLALRDLDGKEITFKELRGKVVFVHFWSKDCPYEEVADPKTVALAEKYKGKDVVCLAIDSNATEYGAEPAKDAKPEECYKEIRKHLTEKKMSFPVYIDRGNKIADLFGAQHTPHCYVIDAKGTLRYMGGLDDDPKGEKGDATKQYVRDAVDALLANKEVPVKESAPYGCGIKRVKVKA
ncbi:MAG TPA: redoxin domain-containing protein [Planctomycetota bacterium]|nr:redoxin domain-containing protein [Planctomycetota bacterium]